MSSDTAGMIDHLHNLASVFALVNQAGGYVHGHVQTAYDWYFGLFGRDYLVADIAGGMIITMTVFWVLGALYTVLDLTHWPAALYQYKTQDKEVRSTVSILPFSPQTT